MAEDRSEGRELTWKRLMPWTLLFRTFQVTLDHNKLFLAVGGILTTALVWWLLAGLFTLGGGQVPAWGGDYKDKAGGDEKLAWANFRKDRLHWNLMRESAGLGGPDLAKHKYSIEDVAETIDEYNLFKDVQGPDAGKAFLDKVNKLEQDKTIKPEEARTYRARVRQYALIGQDKPAGRLVVSPWSEDRGPNPYLMVTGQSGIPWDAGHFWDWFLRDQFPVMIEPLVKLVRPVIYLLSPRNTFTSRFYFLTVALSTVMIWSLFGGAITRIAAVEVTRGEKIGLFDALGFTSRRLMAYLTAPMIPLIVVAILAILLSIFGVLGAIPWVGDFFGGLLWFLPIVFGLVMAGAVVGLIGWPLMVAHVSVEGNDSWEAVTRAFGYITQRPWHCLWYGALSLVYGGVVIFFVGFMGSLTVYLAKWGVTSPASQWVRGESSHYLFVYAPTSFGWRELLLEGAVVQSGGKEVVEPRTSRPESLTPGSGGVSRYSRINPEAYEGYVGAMGWGAAIGAFFVSIWLGVAFVLVLSFGYVFFWSANTISYLLLRKSLEGQELEEIYLEEEDYDSQRSLPTPVPAPPPAPTRATTLPVVEAPRPAPAPVPVAAPPPAPAPVPAPAPPPPAAPAPVEKVKEEPAAPPPASTPEKEAGESPSA